MTTNDTIDTLLGVTRSTLYAAFSENGDIWPTTIRRTLADAVGYLAGRKGRTA
jgi:hypothetical protein